MPEPRSNSQQANNRWMSSPVPPNGNATSIHKNAATCGVTFAAASTTSPNEVGFHDVAERLTGLEQEVQAGNNNAGTRYDTIRAEFGALMPMRQRSIQTNALLTEANNKLDSSKATLDQLNESISHVNSNTASLARASQGIRHENKHTKGLLQVAKVGLDRRFVAIQQKQDGIRQDVAGLETITIEGLGKLEPVPAQLTEVVNTIRDSRNRQQEHQKAAKAEFESMKGSFRVIESGLDTQTKVIREGFGNLSNKTDEQSDVIRRLLNS